ncbi:unnamed protein product [Lactuca saligna]|uniref:Transmembrane protein n=1 Tax=Lactuca saligna TaxID=75948 RepID=A0AA35ZUW8_LACSI|nr:unnamed protein product [Lactuca saligna]
MERFDPDTKHGWRAQTLSSISLPPLPLVAFLAIVVFLLSLSEYSNFKSWSSYVGINFQLLLFLMPVILVFFLSSSWIIEGRWFNLGSRKRKDLMNTTQVSDEY